MRVIEHRAVSPTRLYKPATLHRWIADNGPAPGVGGRETIALPPVMGDRYASIRVYADRAETHDHPPCPLCQGAMSLFRIMPEKPDHDRRTFQCTQCKHEHMLVVKYQ